jgi:hypothetical protein
MILSFSFFLSLRYDIDFSEPFEDPLPQNTK